MRKAWPIRSSVLACSALLVAVALSTAACGSSGGGGGGGGGVSGSAAGIVPGDALAFVTVDSDLGSTQIKNAQAVLDKFPFHVSLLAQLERAAGSTANGAKLAKVEGSIGPQTDLAVLKVAGKPAIVLLTKPTNAATFTSTLGPKAVSETLDGWTVVSDSQAALDAVKSRTSNLSDDAAFKAAEKALPGDALVTAFAGKAAFTSLAAAGGSRVKVSPGTGALIGSKVNWLSAAATSHDAGIEVELHANTTQALPKVASRSLSGEIPGGALVALSFDGSSSLGGLTSSALAEGGSTTGAAVGKVQKSLGISVQDLTQAVSGPGILYIKPGAPLPELTLAIEPADAAQAQQTVAKLLAKLTKGAKPTTVTADGVTLQDISLGPVGIYYGTFGGQLVVTDSQAAIGELQAKDNRLSGDDAFKAASKASGLDLSDPAWLYVDLKNGIPVAESFASLAGTKLPTSVGGNVKPLQSFVAYGTMDGQDTSAVLFLQTG